MFISPSSSPSLSYPAIFKQVSLADHHRLSHIIRSLVSISFFLVEQKNLGEHKKDKI